VGREIAMKPARILIADDEPKIRLMVRTCLSDGAYELDEAGDGVEVLDAVRRNPPDLVLLDLAMPRMDGMTTLQELRPMQNLPHLRVIVMTAHGSVQTAIRALRLGASDFLEKPFLPDDLRLSVASVLDETPAPIAGGEEGYQAVLQRVREAMRGGKFAEGEALLMKAGTIADRDPEFLNLAGVLHESHGRIDSARRFYERSAAQDRSYQPAHENLKRLGELRRHGKTKRKVAFGDERGNGI
jgi:DNA-binding response OmpR family regulator